jgi:hypothetical protein
LVPDFCCCLNDGGSKILFRIYWQWVNQVSHVAFLWRHRPSQCWWSAWNADNPLNQCACQLFLILLVACLDSQLIQISTSRFSRSPIGRSPMMWCPMTWEAKPLAHPVQSSYRCKWRWDVFGPDVQNEPQPVMLEPHVCCQCQGDFLQQFWKHFLQKHVVNLCTEPGG